MAGFKFEKVNTDFQTTFIANKLQHMNDVKKQFQVDALVTPLASNVSTTQCNTGIGKSFLQSY